MKFMRPASPFSNGRPLVNNETADRRIVCQVQIDSAPGRGTWNMALDEAMLETAADRGLILLRWYRWEEPTVSLGYFQSDEFSTEHPELATLPVVRRLSGGGAILHHHELTYAIAIPGSHPLAAQPAELYCTVHEEIIAIMREHGIPAAIRGDTSEAGDQFLCFARADCNDVVLAGHKILGSAQRRRRGAVLQHGSLLLERSSYAPQHPGLFDLIGGEVVNLATFEKALGIRLGKTLGNGVKLRTFDDEQLARAHMLEDRYRVTAKS